MGQESLSERDRSLCLMLYTDLKVPCQHSPSWLIILSASRLTSSQSDWFLQVDTVSSETETDVYRTAGPTCEDL